MIFLLPALLVFASLVGAIPLESANFSPGCIVNKHPDVVSARYTTDSDMAHQRF